VSGSKGSSDGFAEEGADEPSEEGQGAHAHHASSSSIQEADKRHQRTNEGT
jgi:hypothetical protein